jgi:hypothetical protein
MSAPPVTSEVKETRGGLNDITMPALKSVAMIGNSSLGNSRLDQLANESGRQGQHEPKIEWFLGWCRIRPDQL